MLREELCRRSTQAPWPREVQTAVEDLVRLIDYYRPLGADGKHGDLHTADCGCEDPDRQYPPDCLAHIEVQHRDGKPPWCAYCGWNRGRPAVPARHKDDMPGLLRRCTDPTCTDDRPHGPGRHK